MKLLKTINEQATFNSQQKADMEKLVSQYTDSKIRGKNIRNRVGEDLEMLEYSPEDVNKMLPAIMSRLK